MHEQSETIQRPGGYVTVYGGTQFPLPREFGFEKKGYYPSLDSAVTAARWRSRMGGGNEAAMSTAPQYGFSAQGTPSALSPSMSPMLGAAIQIQRMNMLSDREMEQWLAARNSYLEPRIGQEIVRSGARPVNPQEVISRLEQGNEFDQAASTRATTNRMERGY